MVRFGPLGGCEGVEMGEPVMMWVAYACVWIASSAAIAFAVYITHNPVCLWAFLIPALVNVKTGPRADD